MGVTLADLELIVYDFEVFAHDWLVVFKHVSTGRREHFWNERADELIDFVEDHAEAMLVSYNGSHYDQWILKAIAAGCTPEEVKEINDAIIAGDPETPIWEHPYLAGTWFRVNDVDLMKDTQVGTSLKSIEGHLGMSVDESEVDFDVAHRLSEAERADVLRYCEHDVDATEGLLAVRRDYLETKLTLGERAGLTPARSLYLTNAKLTAAVLGAEREEHDDERKYEYPDNLVRERIPREVFAFFDRVRDASVPDEELWTSKLEILVGRCPVTLGFGGIHGAIPKYREEATAGRCVINIDVSSYYPSLMVVNGYTSRNMASPRVFEDIYHERLRAKAAGDKATANALKLIVNTNYGATLNRYNDLYDPLMARSVCISGQLYLLELAETLVESVRTLELIQLNTDGIMVSVDRARLGEVRGAYHRWEARTGFGLEEDDISVVWQKDVNNYAMRTTDGHEKVKGGYLVRGTSTVGAFSINNNATVVSDALRAYLLDGVPVEETIGACEDPGRFQLIAKAGGKFSRVYQLVDGEEVEMQRCNRVFATTDERLGRLYKVKAATGQVVKVESLPDHCLVCNTGMPDMSEIDRQFYIGLALKRANDFQGGRMATAKKPAEYGGMNVWQKLAQARRMVSEAGLSKSGVNDYAGWTYMELGDVVGVQTQVFAEVGLVEVFTFEPAVPERRVVDKETGEVTVTGGRPALATSTVVNVDNPEETIEFRLSWLQVEEIVSKRTGQASQNALQRQGSEQTYLRRYLKMQVLDLAVPDEVDAAPQRPAKEPAKNAAGSKTKVSVGTKKPATRKAARPATTEEREETSKALAGADAKATQLQVRQLRKAIRTLKDAHGEEPEVSAYIAEIALETDSLKGEFTKRQAGGYITRLGELKEQFDSEGGE